MHLAYPIQAILIYFAILFAPDDVDRITVEMPNPSPAIELVRNGQTWESGGNAYKVEGGTLVVFGPNGKESMKIGDFVAIPGDHDWNKDPKFTLGGGTTLEKVATGFTMRRNAAGGEGNGVYQIRHHEPVAEVGSISINVLGEVVTQGVHRVPANGTVRDALVAAGGQNPGADMKRVSLIRGPAGSVPTVVAVDLTIAEASGPRIYAGDTIHVPKEGDGVQYPTADPDDAAGVASGKAPEAVETWLAGIDAGEYGRSWNDAGEFFRKSITEAGWGEALTKFRKPLGTLKSRKLLDAKKAKSLSGAPDGEYVVMHFETSFTARERAFETVTFMKEKDGSWKAAGYFIR